MKILSLFVVLSLVFQPYASFAANTKKAAISKNKTDYSKNPLAKLKLSQMILNSKQLKQLSPRDRIVYLQFISHLVATLEMNQTQFKFSKEKVSRKNKKASFDWLKELPKITFSFFGGAVADNSSGTITLQMDVENLDEIQSFLASMQDIQNEQRRAVVARIGSIIGVKYQEQQKFDEDAEIYSRKAREAVTRRIEIEKQLKTARGANKSKLEKDLESITSEIESYDNLSNSLRERAQNNRIYIQRATDLITARQVTQVQQTGAMISADAQATATPGAAQAAQTTAAAPATAATAQIAAAPASVPTQTTADTAGTQAAAAETVEDDQPGTTAIATEYTPVDIVEGDGCLFAGHLSIWKKNSKTGELFCEPTKQAKRDFLAATSAKDVEIVCGSYGTEIRTKVKFLPKEDLGLRCAKAFSDALIAKSNQISPEKYDAWALEMKAHIENFESNADTNKSGKTIKEFCKITEENCYATNKSQCKRYQNQVCTVTINILDLFKAALSPEGSDFFITAAAAVDKIINDSKPSDGSR